MIDVPFPKKMTIAFIMAAITAMKKAKVSEFVLMGYGIGILQNC
jgi:hypothetical protein